jgi:hypothetical protein
MGASPVHLSHHRATLNGLHVPIGVTVFFGVPLFPLVTPPAIRTVNRVSRSRFPFANRDAFVRVLATVPRKRPADSSCLGPFYTVKRTSRRRLSKWPTRLLLLLPLDGETVNKCV